jgi:hypothetical protein
MTLTSQFRCGFAGLIMLSATKLLRTCIPSTFNALKRFEAGKGFSNLTRKLSTYDPSKVRNVAIIAHVDHGMRLLTNALLLHMLLIAFV